MRQRKNVSALSATDVQNLRNAFGQLQPHVPRSIYEHFVQIHELSAQHNSELFLPWHRALIFDFETALQTIDQSVTLPYWDWLETGGIPSIFADDGPANPLFVERYTDQQRHNLRYPSENDLKFTMKATNFRQFGGYDSKGRLELKLHDPIHLWVGPDMAEIETSPRDPIFWVHHANVDRLWAEWEVDHPNQGPEDLTQLLTGLDNQYTVADVMDIGDQKLGYEYVQTAAALVFEHEHLKNHTSAQPLEMVPQNFSQAELRFEGLHPMGPLPEYLDVFVNGTTNHAGTLALFGFHTHAHTMKMKPKGKMMKKMNRKLNLTMDITEALSHISKETPVEVHVVLSHPSRSPDQPLALGFDRITLAFPS